MKLLCPDPKIFSSEALELIKKNFLSNIKDLTQSNFNKIGKNYNIIFTRFTKYIGSEIMSKNTKVKYILTPTTNPEDYIDLNLARKRKIKVFSLKNDGGFLKSIPATAEHTFLLILALSRNLIEATESTSLKKWNPGDFKGQELKGKTLGIIGLGRLGKKVASFAKTFEMNVIFYDKKIQKNNKFQKVSSIYKLVSMSDIITIHASLNNETFHLINKKVLSRFKKNSILINTARGSIIDSNALIDSLKKKKIKGAAIDLIEDEFFVYKKKREPLLSYAKKNSNILITPHIGGFTEESVKKTDLFILKKFNDFLLKNKSKQK
tara:strand:+ start:1114 stop:2076 length:963 start_codon:yes stop_codon:yes gene_type:complete